MKSSCVGKTLTVLLLSILMHFTDSQTSIIDGGNSTRTPKFFPFSFFPLQTIIRFLNTECGSSAAFKGTCFTRRECSDLSGLSTIRCASKRGVCCIIHRTCGGTSNVNNTYFNNPGYPAAYGGGPACTIIVNRCNADICQLRLDFLDFSLFQPDATGNCVTDFITITGGSSSVPRICGENSGQHVYINFNGNAPITITIGANAASSFFRRWNIRLIQLACNCPTIAPSGCMTYYSGASGTVKSFNYGTSPNQAPVDPQNAVGTREMANLNYGVCIRVEAGYCRIRWYTPSDDRYSFTVSDLADDVTTVGTPQGSLRGDVCTTDFVVIPNPTDEQMNPLNVDRFCGTGFIPILTSVKPFVMNVITNANEGTIPGMMDSANRGFKLNYAQEPCGLF